MSDNDKDGFGGCKSAVLIEQSATSATSRHKPIHPLDIQDDTQKDHLRSAKTPSVTAVKTDSKDNVLKKDSRDVKERDSVITSEKQKHKMAKKLSSIVNKREFFSDTLKLAPPTVTEKKTPKYPRATVDSKDSEHTDSEKEASIAGESTQEEARPSSAMSDEAEASGRGRGGVSRAVRSLLCCGLALHPPSEHDVSPRTHCDDIA